MNEEARTFDEVIEEIVEPTEQKPRPWLEWIVGGETYKLKLTGSIITKLEATLKGSLLFAVLDNGIPELRVMLMIIQGALQKFHHGMKSTKVEELYDKYIEDGHSQTDLLKDVIYPLMYDAGFFTTAQWEMIREGMKDLDNPL